MVGPQFGSRARFAFTVVSGKVVAVHVIDDGNSRRLMSV
jgi:hypothetical protein